MRWLFHAVAAAIFLSGCSSTIQVRKDEPMNNDRVFNYDQVNAWMDGASGLTICLDDRLYRADSAHVSGDSTVLIESGSGERHALVTGLVVKVLRRDRGAGALTGALAGTLGGFAAGMVLTPIVASSHETQREAGLVLTFWLTAVGCTFGTVIGWGSGSIQECRFRQDGAFPARDSTGNREQVPQGSVQAP